MAEFASDTIFDILSRLPVKSLARFRRVSKRWCAYIDDDYFGILHGERAVEELTPLMYDPNLSCIVGFDIIKSEEGKFTLEAKKVMSLESELKASCSKYREYIVGVGSTNRGYLVGGSCNGLLYLSLHDILHITSLAVIHPLRKEFYKLPPMQRLLGGLYYLDVEESHGLGFDVSTNTFKMVCVFREENFQRVRLLISQVPPYPIYGNGIFAHGCLYWLAPCGEPKSKSREEIICFDVRNEEFTTICPPKKIGRSDYSVYCQLVDLHGEVGYAYFYNDSIEVWILNQKEWVKHCQFSRKPPLHGYIRILGRWNNDGDILIKSYAGRNYLFVYRLKSGVLDDLNFMGKEYGLQQTYMYMYPASSMFSIRGINKTANSIETDLDSD
ncbi:F-box domain-containing protein [Artemisia annua]|uniref:F-box domain-containing protein n=1 Tax=Artemisia annua TaxID=35608 RepID=A0A2U1PWM1_ARTAN|nr:F-box domain-containing protein [Artemisia annua]